MPSPPPPPPVNSNTPLPPPVPATSGKKHTPCSCSFHVGPSPGIAQGKKKGRKKEKRKRKKKKKRKKEHNQNQPTRQASGPARRQQSRCTEKDLLPVWNPYFHLRTEEALLTVHLVSVLRCMDSNPQLFSDKKLLGSLQWILSNNHVD